MIEQFLLFCAAVDRTLLQGDDFSTERAKYAAAGTFVFLTAIFAGIFAAVALSSITSDPRYYGGAAALWAVFVFCLDRQIVMSIRKSDHPLKQLVIAIPRLAIAVCIGLIVSKPFELWVFSPEIQSIIHSKDEQHQRAQKEAHDRLIDGDNATLQTAIDRMNAENERWNGEKRELEGKVEEARKAVAASTAGKISTQQSLQLSRDRMEQECLPQIKQRADWIDNNHRLMEQNRKKMQSPASLQPVEPRHAIGLLEKLDALEEFGQRSKTAKMSLLFLTGLFVIIEVLPVIVKLLLASGPYDEQLLHREKTIKQRIEEKWAAIQQTSTDRIKTLITMEQQIVEKQSLQLEEVITGKELDHLLAKSRLSLAKCFANSIARRLKKASEALNAYDASLGAADGGDLQKAIDAAAREMVFEQGGMQVKKGALKGLAMFTIAKMNTIVDYLRRKVH